MLNIVDSLDRKIINELQEGFPVSDHPYAEVAEKLGTTEAVLLQKLSNMLDDGLLSRFGPMYHAEQLGGGLALCAMQVPKATFDKWQKWSIAFPRWRITTNASIA
jgi:DNA-binding Lrp family transcriptional regulator